MKSLVQPLLTITDATVARLLSGRRASGRKTGTRYMWVVELLQSGRGHSSTLLLAASAGLLAACGGGGDSQSTNANTGTSVNATVAWDFVPDPSVRGYRVYFGTGSGAYLQTYGTGLDAGNVTSYSVTGLSRGTRYYFVATAYDATGNESGYSNEVFKDIP